MNSLHPKLEALIPMARAIQATAGEYCEVVIHDIVHPEQSVVFIAGNVTNRQLGAPLTDLILEKVRNNHCEDMLAYGTTTRDGKSLRSSTVFIRDDAGKVIGCLCVNQDLTPIVAWRYFLGRTLAVDTVVLKETFTNDVSETLNAIIKQVIDSYHVPVSSLAREEKLNIIRQLDEKGVFLVKGAVDLLASELGVSRYSVYNYIEEVRE